LPSSALIHRHVQLAHQLLPLAAVFGVVLAIFVGVDMARRADAGRLNDLERRFVRSRPDADASPGGPRLAGVYRVSAALVVVLALLTAIQVYRVGDAGAKAAWSGRLSPGAPAPLRNAPAKP
jgi:hypothetical protein